ncbi:MAG: phosphomevalonate kinase [Nanoarchaeota archaeon]
MITRAPGKLMLSGEWSVLELGNPSIVLAVDRFVSADIKTNDSIVLEAKNLSLKTKAVFDGKQLKLIDLPEEGRLSELKHAVETALIYLCEKKEIIPFHLSVSSEQTFGNGDQGEVKLGFGSSAALTVASIAGILQLHGLATESDEDRLRLYKLACISHYHAQGKIGSAFDIAASCYGGAIQYKRFDGSWLSGQLGRPLNELVAMDWPHLLIQPLPLPESFRLVVGFSGISASTKELVLKMRDYKAKHLADYDYLIGRISKTSEQIVQAIVKKDEEEIIAGLKDNRLLLKLLGERSGLDLESAELNTVINLMDGFGAAKFSGAGVGDCAIGVCFSAEAEEHMKRALHEEGHLVDVSLSDKGVYHG